MRNILGLCSILLFSACDLQYVGGEPLAQMTFSHVNKYPIYVASYEVNPVDASRVSLSENWLIASPADIIYDYLNSRFEASGSKGKLKITIKNIDVSYHVVDSDYKVGELLGINKKDLYVVSAVLGLKAYGVTKYDHKEVTLKAHRNIYVSEYSSVVDREKVQMQALDSLIDDLDIAIRKILKEDLSLL